MGREFQAVFQVPRELETGVYREGTGLIGPGDRFVLPDQATPIDDDGEYVLDELKAPHHLLIPLNEDADELLQRTYSGQVPAVNGKGEVITDKDGNVKTVLDPRKKLLKRFGEAEKEPSAKAKANARKRAKQAEEEAARAANVADTGGIDQVP